MGSLESLAQEPVRFIPDEDAMRQLGEELAVMLPRGSLVTLSGELGAGKSLLVRSIIHALGYTGRVKSPTYTLMETYDVLPADGQQCRVGHLDLYRLTAPEELDYLGFDELYRDCDLVFIEWPEQGGERLPRADLHLCIDYVGEQARQVVFQFPVSQGPAPDEA